MMYSKTMKRSLLALASLTLIITCIGYIFYTQELQYWLPTPVPEDYKEVPIGEFVSLENFNEGKKKFIHFYNPNCPCSKFNFTTYKELLKNYSGEFECYAVVQETLEGISQRDLDYLKKLNVTLIADEDKTIAKAMGVYATPQIVLLDEANSIYYRGNYNQSRYCTNAVTSYAQIAIDSLLVKSQFYFPATAFTAYGCPLERHAD